MVDTSNKFPYKGGHNYVVYTATDILSTSLMRQYSFWSNTDVIPSFHTAGSMQMAGSKISSSCDLMIYAATGWQQKQSTKLRGFVVALKSSQFPLTEQQNKQLHKEIPTKKAKREKHTAPRSDF